MFSPWANAKTMFLLAPDAGLYLCNKTLDEFSGNAQCCSQNPIWELLCLFRLPIVLETSESVIKWIRICYSWWCKHLFWWRMRRRKWLHLSFFVIIVLFWIMHFLIMNILQCMYPYSPGLSKNCDPRINIYQLIPLIITTTLAEVGATKRRRRRSNSLQQ